MLTVRRTKRSVERHNLPNWPGEHPSGEPKTLRIWFIELRPREGGRETDQTEKRGGANILKGAEVSSGCGSVERLGSTNPAGQVSFRGIRRVMPALDRPDQKRTDGKRLNSCRTLHGDLG